MAMSELSNGLLSELRAANSARGEAQAFVHVAGYTFKLGFERLTWLLNEDRWRQCGFTDIEAFAESIQFGPAMKAAAEKRKELGILFKQASEKTPLSNKKIAKALNASNSSIDRDVRGAPNGAAEEKSSKQNNGADRSPAPNGAPTLPEGERGAGKLVVAREARKARDQAANETQITASGLGSIEMRLGVVPHRLPRPRGIKTQKNGRERQAQPLLRVACRDAPLADCAGRFAQSAWRRPCSRWARPCRPSQAMRRDGRQNARTDCGRRA